MARESGLNPLQSPLSRFAPRNRPLSSGHVCQMCAAFLVLRGEFLALTWPDFDFEPLHSTLPLPLTR